MGNVPLKKAPGKKRGSGLQSKAADYWGQQADRTELFGAREQLGIKGKSFKCMSWSVRPRILKNFQKFSPREITKTSFKREIGEL